MSQWYVVSNEVGTILAVYGSALSDMAESKCKELAGEFPDCGIYLHNVVGHRPSVGGYISMKGQPTRWCPATLRSSFVLRCWLTLGTF